MAEIKNNRVVYLDLLRILAVVFNDAASCCGFKNIHNTGHFLCLAGFQYI